MMEEARATVYFEVKDREIRILLPLPHKGDKKWSAASPNKLDQERRRRWRVMLLTLKAQLEAVETGILTFEDAFLSHIVIPGQGKTIGEALIPKLGALYSGKPLPALLAENQAGKAG